MLRVFQVPSVMKSDGLVWRKTVPGNSFNSTGRRLRNHNTQNFYRNFHDDFNLIFNISDHFGQFQTVMGNIVSSNTILEQIWQVKSVPFLTTILTLQLYTSMNSRIMCEHFVPGFEVDATLITGVLQSDEVCPHVVPQLLLAAG